MIQSVQLCLNQINGTTISTVLLFKNNTRDPDKYETCMFFPDGDSKVVDVYLSKQEAIDGHNAIFRFELNHAQAKADMEVVKAWRREQMLEDATKFKNLSDSLDG
jgi:hypothetical protein